MIPDLVLVRRADWERLAQAEQEALRRAARTSAEAQREYWRQYAAEALATLEEAGIEVNEIEDPEAFRRAVEPVYERHGGRWGDLVERIRATGAP